MGDEGVLRVTRRTQGIVEVVLSGICFGFLAYFGREAYSRGIASGELLSLRFLVSALALLAISLLVWRPGKTWLLKISARELGHCTVLGILGYAVFSSCFFVALNYISASLTVLLLYLYPCLVAIASPWVLGEPLERKDTWALVISTLGLVLVVGIEWQVTSPVGILLGLGSAIFYAAYILYSRKTLATTSAWTSVFYIQVAAGLVLGLLNFSTMTRPLQIMQESWLLMSAIGVISTLVAMALFLDGLKKLSSTEVSILSNTEPLTGLLVAAFVMQERMSGLQYLGSLLVLAGLCLLALKKKKEVLYAV